MNETRHEPIITIRGLERSFGGNLVLNGRDLDIHRGETHVVIGRRGCG